MKHLIFIFFLININATKTKREKEPLIFASNKKQKIEKLASEDCELPSPENTQETDSIPLTPSNTQETNYTLLNVARHLDIKIEDEKKLHNALPDVKLLIEVYKKLKMPKKTLHDYKFTIAANINQPSIN
ncbi:hypothetical protein [Alphaproteobacteria bacterium endosymbiont of Tiliacea citrago]|uniref:hypothetical protein n=1 Tax=Alphaproteobacteria bacterium endosymbiont of Tiliacea citrago TaxID=3077944 RepID=UPI00313C90A8